MLICKRLTDSCYATKQMYTSLASPLVCSHDVPVEPAARSRCPEDEDDYEQASTVLKRRFAGWAADNDRVELQEDTVEDLLHYKWGYMDRHLTRWRRGDLSELYLELYPAKVIVDADGLDEVFDKARVFITFLAETELLDAESDTADVLLDHLSRIQPKFRTHMLDPSRFSFGKRIWTQARSEGVDLTDKQAMDTFITRFNAPAQSRTRHGVGSPPPRSATCRRSRHPARDATTNFREAAQAPVISATASAGQ